MKNLYTSTGWVGEKHDSNLGVKDIAKMTREFLKKTYPNCKFSVRKEHTSSINVALMSAPFSPFATPDVNVVTGHDARYGLDDFMKNWANSIAKGYYGINHYYINDSKYLTDEAKVMFTNIYKFLKSYNYDDSDIMTDYFDTNFYVNLAIGKWDKPFIKTN
jgi:Large polyvalent protein associated domain 29